jgi:hypothetical protein
VSASGSDGGLIARRVSGGTAHTPETQKVSRDTGERFPATQRWSG